MDFDVAGCRWWWSRVWKHWFIYRFISICRPLPHFRTRPHWKPPGNPEYARNTLRFPKDEESCRMGMLMLMLVTLQLYNLGLCGIYRVSNQILQYNLVMIFALMLHSGWQDGRLTCCSNPHRCFFEDPALPGVTVEKPGRINKTETIVSCSVTLCQYRLMQSDLHGFAKTPFYIYIYMVTVQPSGTKV